MFASGDTIGGCGNWTIVMIEPLLAEIRDRCLRGETGCWKGDIAEVLIYSEALSEAKLRAVQQYLGRKYGLGGR